MMNNTQRPNTKFAMLIINWPFYSLKSVDWYKNLPTLLNFSGLVPWTKTFLALGVLLIRGGSIRATPATSPHPGKVGNDYIMG